MAAYLCALLYIRSYVPCPPLDKSFESYLVNFTVKLKFGDGYSTIPFRALVPILDILEHLKYCRK